MLPTQVEEDLWEESMLKVFIYRFIFHTLFPSHFLSSFSCPSPISLPLPTTLQQQCYHHLTEWGDLEKASVVNIDDSTNPDLNCIWNESYYKVGVVRYVLALISCTLGALSSSYVAIKTETMVQGWVGQGFGRVH